MSVSGFHPIRRLHESRRGPFWGIDDDDISVMRIRPTDPDIGIVTANREKRIRYRIGVRFEHRGGIGQIARENRFHRWVLPLLMPIQREPAATTIGSIRIDVHRPLVVSFDCEWLVDNGGQWRNAIDGGQWRFRIIIGRPRHSSAFWMIQGRSRVQ